MTQSVFEIFVACAFCVRDLVRGDWSKFAGVVKGDTMSDVEVEYKVRR